MPGVFEDERREYGRISPYPYGTGRIWPGRGVGAGLWWVVALLSYTTTRDIPTSRKDLGCLIPRGIDG